MTIAALFVQTNGHYYGLSDVDPWDEVRDARLYQGPHPVVAHPPCARWCRLAAMVEARALREPQRYRKGPYGMGEDGGAFKSALASVRRWGGVLEHPAYSAAWKCFGLPRPPPEGGWWGNPVNGWVCHVEQGHYGHRARKATWLYAVNCEVLPELRWGPAFGAAYVTDGRGDAKSRSPALASWCGNHLRGAPDDRPRLSKREASSTPPEFRDLLLALARSVIAPAIEPTTGRRQCED